MNDAVGSSALWSKGTRRYRTTHPRLPAYRSTVETFASPAELSRRTTNDRAVAMAAAAVGARSE
jgi:hypothetical protein